MKHDAVHGWKVIDFNGLTKALSRPVGRVHRFEVSTTSIRMSRIDEAAKLDAGARLHGNPIRLCALRAMQMAMFPMAVLSVFLNQRVEFDVAEIMLLQAVFGLTVALFEFPSGYIADRIGYRRCLVLACLAWTIAWPIYGTATTWPQVVAAELLLGVGLSLASGCDSALLYESLLAREDEAHYARWSGRQISAGQIAEGCAALAAGWMFARGAAWPFFAQSIASAIGLVIALTLVEPERERPGFGDSLGQARAMIRHVAIENRPLRALIAATVVFSLASYIPVWTIQLYALDAGLDRAWLGPMWAVANFSVAIAALVGHRVLGRVGLPSVALGCAVLIVAGYLGLGLSVALGGFAFYYLLTVVRGAKQPILDHREQQLVPSRDRAGSVSLRSMSFRLGFLVVGPVIGLCVDRFGQHGVMLVLAGGFLIAGSLAARGLARADRGQAAAEGC
jgi:MFS family permease